MKVTIELDDEQVRKLRKWIRLKLSTIERGIDSPDDIEFQVMGRVFSAIEEGKMPSAKGDVGKGHA